MKEYLKYLVKKPLKIARQLGVLAFVIVCSSYLISDMDTTDNPAWVYPAIIGFLVVVLGLNIAQPYIEYRDGLETPKK